MVKKKLVVLTGAGISAESGVATFWGSGGLWEGYDIMEVASPEGWRKDFRLVLEFYNARRKNIASVEPNNAHTSLVELEEDYDVFVITQNIDNLHEQAGSSNVLHLHGEITKACSSKNKNAVTEIGFKDIKEGDVCPEGFQMRPYIVWFGEDVPLIPTAAELVSQADILLIIGTSLEVYPAAGLINFSKPNVPIYVIDPSPLNGKLNVPNEVMHLRQNAQEGMEKLKGLLS